MDIQFTKYHGTGNDFIIIDDRLEQFDVLDTKLIAEMCSRRFGIGADGLILLREKDDFDFQMVYFNSDGNQSSMCGNGGRCIVHFAHSLGLFSDQCNFLAIDGSHEAYVLDSEIIKLKMKDVPEITRDGDAYVMDTGSPHYVIETKQIDQLNIKNKGAEIRYSDKYKSEGINVNFIMRGNEEIFVASYERGVEDETFSCGTGVTASAISIHQMHSDVYSSPISIKTKGGLLKVYFDFIENNKYSNVWLEGPAVVTYEGTFTEE